MLYHTYTTTGNESINELFDKKNKMIEDGTYNSSPRELHPPKGGVLPVSTTSLA